MDSSRRGGRGAVGSAGDVRRSAQRLADREPAVAGAALLGAAGGASAFKQLYAQDVNANQKNAFGKCVSRLNAQDQQNANKASALCRAEQADTGFAAVHTGKTFDQVYGTGKNLKNAFGNCVSSKTNAAGQQQQQSTIKAAKTCRTLQKTSQTTFAATYGAKKNAFGKCVAAHINA
jgi:hypothetical protein